MSLLKVSPLKSVRVWQALLALLVGAVACSVSSAADLRELIRHIPPQANGVVAIHAEQLYQSELARSEDWAGQHARGLSAGGMVLPPGTRHVLVGTEINFESMRPSWEAAVVDMASPPSIAEVAKRDGGRVDLIGSHPTVSLPGDATLIEWDAHLVGVMAPANRQAVARWLTFHGGGLGTALAPELEQAARLAETAKGQIFLAFDLRGLLSSSFVEQQIPGMECLKDQPDKAKLAALLASVQGVSLGIQVDAARHGELRIEFADDAASLVPCAKSLVLEVLANAGAAIYDLQDWEVSVSGHAILLKGKFSEPGMQRVLSLIELPTHWLVEAKAEKPYDAGGSRDMTPYASLAYFQSVEKLLRDLRAQRREGKSLGQAALWYDRFANTIDRLPKANVDRQLLDYGAQTAEMLRQVALGHRDSGIESHRRVTEIYPTLSGQTQTIGAFPNYFQPYTPYGIYPYSRFAPRSVTYFNYRNIAAERRAVRAEEIAKAASNEQQILSEITQATQKIRDAMTERYGFDF